MNRRLPLNLLIRVVALFLLTLTVKASEITSLPSGTVIPFPAVNAFGPGPQTFDGGITWTSTNASTQGGSVFGYTGPYGFGANGFWTGSLGPMAGVNDSVAAYGPPPDTMTFAFITPVFGVGGFLNYVPGGSTPTTIAVYDSLNTLIESAALTFLTGGGADTGQFLGFLESTPDISFFTLTDNYIGITGLTVQNTSTSVPEPGSLLLLGTGLVGLVGLVGKRLVRCA